jgi:hypothetical protein
VKCIASCWSLTWQTDYTLHDSCSCYPLRFRCAQPQVSHASGVHEKDARLQYLSWRVWGIKRKHAMVAQQRMLEAATEVDDSELSETRSEEAGVPGPVPEEVSWPNS